MFGAQVRAKVTRNRFRELSRQGRQAAARRNRELAELTVEIAKPLTPRSDNNEAGHVHLVDTLRVEVNPRTGAASAVAGDESRGVDYALYVHEGTHLMEGTPFLREAAKLAVRRSRNRSVRLYRG